MTTEQLSMSAFRTIWSALHFPNEPNHCGRKILDLMKANTMTPVQKEMFEALEDHREFTFAKFTIPEITKLLTSNFKLKTDVIAALESGSNDSQIDMPPIETIDLDNPLASMSVNTAQNQDDDSMFGRMIGALFFFGGIVLTIVSEGQAIFYGAIIFGLIKMIRG